MTAAACRDVALGRPKGTGIGAPRPPFNATLALHVGDVHAVNGAGLGHDVFLDHDASKVIGSISQGYLPHFKALGDPRTLNIFNVHVNRMPISGSFQNVKYLKGKFLLAFDHKACDENERNTIKISTEIGTIKIVQIAGLLARRIICYAKKEDTMKIGGRLGFMRFGSRIDLTIPSNVNLDIKIGQKVVGNRTVIGTY